MNNKITLWYITCENDREVLDLSLQQMHDYDCIQHIVIVHTDSKPYPIYKYEKAIHLWHNFGQNIHIPVEDGGFNEFGARRYALKTAEMMNTDWLLQCDADEFYTEAELYRCTTILDIDAVYFPCYSFQTPKKYSVGHRTEQGLIDPHLRMWKNFKGIHFQQNQLLNEGNLHIHPSPAMPDDTEILLLDQMCHIHIHDMIPGKKRGEGYDTEEVEFDWPKHYLEKFKEWHI